MNHSLGQLRSLGTKTLGPRTFCLPDLILRYSLAPQHTCLNGLILRVSIDTQVERPQCRIPAATHNAVDVAAARVQPLTRQPFLVRADTAFHGDMEYKGRGDDITGGVGSHSAGRTDRPARAVVVLDEFGREIDSKGLVADSLRAAYARVIDVPAKVLDAIVVLLTCVAESYDGGSAL